MNAIRIIMAISSLALTACASIGGVNKYVTNGPYCQVNSDYKEYTHLVPMIRKNEYGQREWVKKTRFKNDTPPEIRLTLKQALAEEGCRFARRELAHDHMIGAIVPLDHAKARSLMPQSDWSSFNREWQQYASGEKADCTVRARWIQRLLYHASESNGYSSESIMKSRAKLENDARNALRDGCYQVAEAVGQYYFGNDHSVPGQRHRDEGKAKKYYKLAFDAAMERGAHKFIIDDLANLNVEYELIALEEVWRSGDKREAGIAAAELADIYSKGKSSWMGAVQKNPNLVDLWCNRAKTKGLGSFGVCGRRATELAYKDASSTFKERNTRGLKVGDAVCSATNMFGYVERVSGDKAKIAVKWRYPRKRNYYLFRHDVYVASEIQTEKMDREIWSHQREWVTCGWR